MAAICGISSLLSCSDDDVTASQTGTGKHALTFEVVHPDTRTRASEYGFDDGDRIGLFVTKSDETLEPSGNSVNNELLTKGNDGWNAAEKIFLDNGNYNVYAYYPYSAVSSIDDYEVGVSTDQSCKEDYSASDVMYARSMNYNDLANAVRLNFSHVMSKLTIRLIKSEDYEGELPTKADVFVHSTVTRATLDLNTGIATKKQKCGAKSIKAHQTGSHTYEAIVVPQRLDTRLPLIEIEANGVSYLLESKFVFKKGMNHVVNVVIPSSPEQVKIEVSGEVDNWSSEQTR